MFGVRRFERGEVRDRKLRSAQYPKQLQRAGGTCADRWIGKPVVDHEYTWLAGMRGVPIAQAKDNVSEGQEALRAYDEDGLI